VTGFVLLRVRAHRLLVAAALLSSLLVTTALASLAAYAHTTAEAGVRRALEHQSASRTVLTASARVEVHNQKSVDAGVRAAARRAYDGLPVRVEGVTRSASYALPGALHPGGAPPADHPDLTLFASLDPHRVRIVDGNWPTAAHTGDGTVPAALPVKAAKRLGLHTGDDLRLTSRLSDPPVHVRITGLYRPEDLQSPYWTLDPLEGEAVRTLDYTSYGPLAVTRDAFAGASLPPSETYWLADGDFSHVDVARLPALRDHFAHAVQHFSKAPHTAGAVAQSDLPDVLAGLRRSLLSNRSTLLVAALQLVFLAVLTLLLVAQLLTSERTAETETLQARGASRSRLAAFSALEALLIALPGALLGPLLAVPLVHLLLTRGVLARSGVDSAVQLTPTVWWVAAAAAAACALTVVLPSLRRPATSATKRRRRAGAVVRGGADLALVVLAAVALWQLLGRSSGSGVLSTDAAGDGGGQSLGIDPVLVVAPALALLAGTVLALRLLPLIARLGERRAARGPGLAAALAGWQLARRPGYGSGPTLLLVLAVAMAVLAVGEGASWDRSQTDQAAFRTGGDITAVSSTVPSFGQGGLFTGVDGVSRGVPVARDEFTVHGDRTTQIVATDTRAAAPMLHVRDDLSAEPLPALLKPLPGGRAPADTGVPLPAHTTALRFGLRLSTAHHRDASASGVPQLSVTLRDRYGVPYTFGLGELPADGKRHTLTLDLTAEAGEGGSPAAPLRLTRLSVAYQAPRHNAETRLRLDDLTAAHADGTTTDVPAPHGGRWQAALHYSDDQHLMSDPYQPPETGLIDAGSHGAAFGLHYATGSAPTPRPFVGPAPLPVRLDVSYGPPPGTGPAPLTAVATDRFLDSTGAHVGDPVTLQVGGAELDVTVTGALRALPTTDPARDSAADGGALLLDLGAVDQALTDADKPPLAPQSWWLKTAPGQTVHVAHALRENAAVGSVLVRDELADQLRSDPLTAGPRGALTAIALAAAVLAGAGCAVSAARAAEEREPEFAILRALGASPRRLARVLAAEQGVLLTLALGVGLLLGVLSTRLLIPLLVLTGEGTTARPEPLVLLPPGALAALLAAVLALPVLVAVGTALRRGDPMTALRTERGD
jgi:FtsX-like permease family protein